MDLAEAFLLDQIPLTQRAVVPTALKNAYAAAKLSLSQDPVWNVESAKPHWGRYIQFAVDLAFQKLVENGQWASARDYRSYSKPTGKYLEIQFSHSVLTISQVANPDKQPRDVGFRRNKRLRSQITMDILKDEQEDTSGLPHILLLHGHQSLDFAHLAIPEPTHWQGFQYKTANLMLMAHAVPEPEPPMEDTDIEALMTLKDEIDRWRRDGRTQ